MYGENALGVTSSVDIQGPQSRRMQVDFRNEQVETSGGEHEDRTNATLVYTDSSGKRVEVPYSGRIVSGVVISE